jgi:flagellar biosynthesis protein FlhF
MIVKRFRAATMQAALEMVKNELGEEAVILKSETVPRSGILDVKKKPDVEVVAAVDKQPEKKAPRPNMGGSTGYFAARSPETTGPDWAEFSSFLPSDLMTPQKKTAPSQPKRVAPPKTASASKGNPPAKPRSAKEKRPPVNNQTPISTAPPKDERLDALKTEVHELRSMIQSMTSRIGHIQSEYSLREFADLPGPYAEQVMALMQAGVDNRIARTLVEKAAAAVPVDKVHEPKRLQSVIAQQIADRVQVAGPIKCQKGQARIIVLVGPTGSGKTTTLAKLAANSKFVFDKRVALITADTHRVSALEHLNTFAGISQLPISAVYSPEELKSALIAQRDKDLIFIDTAGRSPRDEKHLLEMKKYLDMAEPTEVHLVLPASIHYIDLLETLRRFSVLNVNRVVISKTDETSALGNCLNIAVESEAPLSYITTGQTIPDDIELANPQRLAQLIMRMI